MPDDDDRGLTRIRFERSDSLVPRALTDQLAPALHRALRLSTLGVVVNVVAAIERQTTFRG